ncbi:MAG: hypothetical protein ACOYVK_16795 [Bacillota bacterium]
MALVVAIMLMGAGYAAWTDRIVVKSTVETGTVDVGIYTRIEGEGGPDLPRYEITDPEVNEWIEANLEHNNKTALFTFSNLYPGAEVGSVLIARNNGTLPVRISEVTVEATNPDGVTQADTYLYDNMEVDVVMHTIDRGEGVANWNPLLDVSEITLSQLEAELDANLIGTVLMPGDELGTIDVDGNLRQSLTFRLDDSGERFGTVEKYDTVTDSPLENELEDMEHQGENEGVIVTITFDFEQAPDEPKPVQP